MQWVNGSGVAEWLCSPGSPLISSRPCWGLTRGLGRGRAAGTSGLKLVRCRTTRGDWDHVCCCCLDVYQETATEHRVTLSPSYPSVLDLASIVRASPAAGYITPPPFSEQRGSLRRNWANTMQSEAQTPPLRKVCFPSTWLGWCRWCWSRNRTEDRRMWCRTGCVHQSTEEPGNAHDGEVSLSHLAGREEDLPFLRAAAGLVSVAPRSRRCLMCTLEHGGAPVNVSFKDISV